MKVSKNRSFVKYILHILGLLVCAVPPILCTLLYFPLWNVTSAEHTLSGGVALLIIICAIPFYKYIKCALESAASYVIWLIIFLFCFLLARVIDQVTVIAFVGFVSNILGALILKIGDKSGNFP